MVVSCLLHFLVLSILIKSFKLHLGAFVRKLAVKHDRTSSLYTVQLLPAGTGIISELCDTFPGLFLTHVYRVSTVITEEEELKFIARMYLVRRSSIATQQCPRLLLSSLYFRLIILTPWLGSFRFVKFVSYILYPPEDPPLIPSHIGFQSFKKMYAIFYQSFAMYCVPNGAFERLEVRICPVSTIFSD